MSNSINKIKEVILDNNFFNTDAGERFKDWNAVGDINAVISFSGRSKNRECYQLPVSSESDGEQVYVTHLYMKSNGQVMVQMGTEDTDDINEILHPSEEPIENFDQEIINEWVELLDF